MPGETGWIVLGIVAWSMKKAAPKSRHLDRQRNDARRLQATYLIRKAQGAGFTLEEIKSSSIWIQGMTAIGQMRQLNKG